MSELDSQIMRLREGDTAVINDLVIHYIGLAINAAKRMDCDIDVALYILVMTIHRAGKKLRDMNLCAYVHKSLIYGLRRHKRENHIVRVPFNAQRQGTLPPKMMTYSEHRRKCNLRLVDILEMCSTSEEHDVVKLRWAGYKDSEIGKMIGRSTSYVNGLRHKLYFLFKESGYVLRR